MAGSGAAQVHDAGQRLHGDVYDEVGHPGHLRQDHGGRGLHVGRQANGLVPLADCRSGPRRGDLQGDGRVAAGHDCDS